MKNLAPSCADCARNHSSLPHAEPWGPIQACTGIALQSQCTIVHYRCKNSRQWNLHWSSPQSLLNSFFNIYFNILTSPKARSAKCCLPFRCQLNSKQLRLSSLLCLFHVRSGTGPGPPRPSSKPGEEIYSGPSSNGNVILSRSVLPAAMLYEMEGWDRGKVRKQSGQSPTQHGRCPQVPSTRQLATELSLILPEKKRNIRNIVGRWTPFPPPQ